MTAALAVVCLALASMLWGTSNASAAEIQYEAALPSISGASLEVQITPPTEPVDCRAEVAPAAAIGWAGASVVPCSLEAPGAGAQFQRGVAEVSGLKSDAEYRYRFIVTSTSGPVEGSGGTFHTFGIESFSLEAVNAAGEPDSIAGAHPYELVTRIVMAHGETRGAEGVAAMVKSILAELPRGLIGNPMAAAECPARFSEEHRCPADSQVGHLVIHSAGGTPSRRNKFEAGIYNMSPARGQAARFGGQINVSTNSYIGAGVRTGDDYGINAGSNDIPTISNPYEFEIRLWGVPASGAHDALRRCGNVQCSVPPGTPERAFLRNPTWCAAPQQARLEVTPYGVPGLFVERLFQMPAITGCENLQFHPSLTLQPTTETAESPTGLHVDLHVPQNEDPNGLATPDLKDAVVQLPPGLTVNPSSANGLEGCTTAQIGLTTPVGTTPMHTTAGPAECPDGAKIGTVEVDTPLLDHPLMGAVYIASPYDNPFDSLLAIYIAVNDPVSGVVIKLAGHVEIGADGQLTTRFEENPQLPFEDFKLDFFDGPRAALKTGATCGDYATTSSLTPWSAPQSGPAATTSDGYKVSHQPGGGNCPTSAGQQPNNPAFEAGSESPLAGAYSPFVLHLRRDDGSQQFSSLTVTPPPGLLGKLAGIPYCSDAALAAAGSSSGRDEQGSASCPSASEVGTVNVGAGAGPSPYYVQGRAYLAGPYKGAPLSLAIITPAVAGPYDLGTVVVRSALDVDPFTSQITVKSDPIPTELKGIPLDVRSIAVKMSRSGFTLNPTNCEAMTLGASVTTTVGQTAVLGNHYQVGNCGALKFKPTLKLSLKGSTKHTGHPALKAVVTYPKKGAYANIARAQVNLPHSEFLDQSNLNKTCTKPVLLEGKCPRTTIYGKVKAWTPLLDKPLKGNVYLVGGFGYKLPALIAELNGQIRVLLKGKVDSGPNKGIRNTFELVPDAPVERFVLEMKGGRKYSLLENSEDLCRKPQRANARFRAQNGRVMQWKPLIANDCGKKSKSKKSKSKSKKSKGKKSKKK
jgi:hypothetical protein